jgi:hypothetical protein
MGTVYYTYLIGWSEKNRWYYGCRYGKKCNPAELWKTYFTSSKHVKNFRENNGEPDVIQIRKIFNDSKSCRDWEHKVLRRMKVTRNDKFLNKTDNISISPESSALGSLKQRGVPKNHSAQGLLNISKANSHPWREEEREKRLEAARVSGLKRRGIKFGPDSEETKIKKSIAHTGKSSGMKGKFHVSCSCIVCKKVMKQSYLNQHHEYSHLGKSSPNAGSRHSDITKYNMRLKRNAFVNNGNIEINIKEYEERVLFLESNPSFTIGHLKRK